MVDVLNGKSEEVDNIVMQEQTIHSKQSRICPRWFLDDHEMQEVFRFDDESLNETMKHFFHRVDASEGGVKNTADMFVKSDKIAFTKMMDNESDDCRYSQTIGVC